MGVFGGKAGLNSPQRMWGRGALTGVPGAPETAQGSRSSVGLQRMHDVVVSYSVSFLATSREEWTVCRRGPAGLMEQHVGPCRGWHERLQR